jgi:hypothetical protein
VSETELIDNIGAIAGDVATTFRRIADADEQRGADREKRERLLGLASLWSEVRFNICGVEHADEPPVNPAKDLT